MSTTTTGPPQTPTGIPSPTQTAPPSVESPVQADAGTDETQASLDVRFLAQQLDAIVRLPGTETERTTRFLELTNQLTGAVGAVYYGSDDSGHLLADPAASCPENFSSALLDQIYHLAAHTQAESALQIAESRSDEPRMAIATPVIHQDECREVLVVLVAAQASDRRKLATVVQAVQLLVAHAAQWRGTDPAMRRESLAIADVFEVARRATEDATPADGIQRIADFLSRQLRARWIVLGSQRNASTCRLLCASHPQHFDRKAPLIAWLEAALGEAMLAGELVTATGDGSADHMTQAMKQVTALVDSQHVYRLPLPGAGNRAWGACLTVTDRELTEDELTAWRSACAVLGPVAQLLHRTRATWWRRMRSSVSAVPELKRRGIALLAAIAIGVMFFVPIPHRVRCQCEVQPATRRYIAAPYEGRLDAVLVKPGDLVQKDDVLARMDSREIELELSRLRAKWRREQKNRDLAMDSRDTAAAQAALLEMEQLQRSIELHEDRLSNLEIRSPNDGIIISGDPKKLVGARLTLGQTLLEVGSLDAMILEVEIPDESISYIRPEGSLEFRLHARPHQSLRAELSRVHPRSEQRESENVFIGEATVEASDLQLLPGMRGHAKVRAEAKSLAWVLFHRAVEAFLFRWGW